MRSLTYQITRSELDEVALYSQQRAAQATEQGIFKHEIAPVTIAGKKDAQLVDQDEGIRSETSLQSLAKLKPAFQADGVFTAGNSSQLSDGAAAILLASKKAVEHYQLKPIARLIGGVWTGGENWRFLEAPIVSVKKLLDKLKMKIYDFDLFENNEAFAISNVLFHRLLGVPYEKLNVYGGAIAWSKTPLGAQQRAYSQAALLFARPSQVPAAWLAEQERLGLLPGFLEANLSILRSQVSAFGQQNIVLESLPQVQMPTLVVWGVNDLVLPNNQAQEGVNRLPQAHLALIPDCGHLPQVERPELFTDAVKQFLASHL